MSRKTIIDYIQDDDPSYDPLEGGLARANVSRETFAAASDRVYFDGYYGPVSAEDWAEQDGREPAKVSDALGILAKVDNEIEDYRVTVIGLCDDEDCDVEHESDEVTASAHDISRAVFASVIEIYGTTPANIR
jgi:hypothetical protein